MGPVTGSLEAQVLWKACKQGCHLTLGLKLARHGVHTLKSCENHTHLGPQVTSLDSFCIALTRSTVAPKLY